MKRLDKGGESDEGGYEFFELVGVVKLVGRGAFKIKALPRFENVGLSGLRHRKEASPDLKEDKFTPGSVLLWKGLLRTESERSDEAIFGLIKV